jgi:SAM-dependent methyltransferase
MFVDKSKTHKLTWRFSYLVKLLLTAVLGKKLFLRTLLRVHWVLRRIAFETAGLVFGDKFQNSSLGLSEDRLKSIIRPKDIVADLGCGTGRWSRASAEVAAKVYGFDFSEENLKIARESGGDIEYIQLDLSKHLGQMLEVDLCLLVHFLEHLEVPEDVLRGLRVKSKRILIEVPDFESDPLNYPRTWLEEPFYFDSDHFREFTLSELLEILDRTGWNPTFLLQRGGTILVVAE